MFAAKSRVEAIYEDGVFKPVDSLDLADGERVRLTVEQMVEAPAGDVLRLARQVYAGLSPQNVDEVEAHARRRRYVTDEEMYQAPKDGQNYERVDGEMRVGPGGARHAALTANLAARLWLFVEPRKLGYVVGSRTGYRWPGRHADRPDNVRAPDVSFTSVGRFPDERLPDGFSELAPDLAVEVLHPDDRARDVLEKVGEYLDVGTRLVWVIDPETRTAIVHRSLTNVRVIGEADTLDGEDVVPGFSCPLRDVLG